MKSSITFSPGERVGPAGSYTIVSQLVGRGGRSIVYFATNEAGSRLVVKLLPPSLQNDPAALAAFKREVSARQTLANDVDFADDVYLVAKYHSGHTLRTLLDDKLALHGRWTDHEAYAVYKKIADTLADFHRFGVHCDVKPENILLEAGSGGWSVRLIDYGSTLLDPGKQSKADTGTPAYEAPERCDPESTVEVSPAADMYSFGVILYEAHTARLPFTAAEHGNTRRLQVEQAIPLTLLRVRQTPEPLVDLIRGLLDKSAVRRPDARKAAAALEPLSIAPRVVEAFQSERTPMSVGDIDSRGAARRGRDFTLPWMFAAFTLAAAIVFVIVASRSKTTVIVAPVQVPIASSAVATTPAIALAAVALSTSPVVPASRLRRRVMPRPLTKHQVQQQCAQLNGTAYECVPGGAFRQGIDQHAADELCDSLGKQCTALVRDQINRAVPEGGEPMSTWVSTYGLARVPVTCADFTDYLNRHRQDPDFAIDLEKEENELADHTKQPLRQRYVARGLPKRRIYDLLSSVACIKRDPSTKEFVVAQELANRPIEAVPWQEAAAYCEEQHGSLPTEAQLERVRRWSGAGPYVWGSRPPTCDALAYDQYDSKKGDHLGECRKTASKGARDVGSSPLDGIPGLDIADLGGNVREWALDGFVMHLPRCGGGVCIDPVMPPQPSGAYVMLGGSYTFGRWYMFSTMRGQYQGDKLEQGSSFRCARNLSKRRD